MCRIKPLRSGAQQLRNSTCHCCNAARKPATNHDSDTNHIGGADAQAALLCSRWALTSAVHFSLSPARVRSDLLLRGHKSGLDFATGTVCVFLVAASALRPSLLPTVFLCVVCVVLLPPSWLLCKLFCSVHNELCSLLCLCLSFFLCCLSVVALCVHCHFFLSSSSSRCAPSSCPPLLDPSAFFTLLFSSFVVLAGPSSSTYFLDFRVGPLLCSCFVICHLSRSFVTF